MENVCVLFGIFLCVSMVLAGGGPVSNDHYVSIDQSNMKVKPGSNVTLNCVGWNGDLAYYIQNRVAWDFTDKDGKTAQLSSGFYMNPSDPYAKMLNEEGRLNFKFSVTEGAAGKPHNFKLMFKNIKFSDDGIYSCSLGDKDGIQISREAVNITVVSPVRKLRLELLDGKGHIMATSESFTEGDTAVKVVPGDYKVRCSAQGSNPEPKMSLLVNQAQTYVAPTFERKIDGEGPTYNGQYVVDQVTLKPRATEQLLMCEGNIVGDYYRTKMAGIKLMVQIDKPHFMCDNLTTIAGERYRKIQCELHTKEGGQPPMCEHVFWKFGDSGKVIEMGGIEKWTDPNKEYNIMESECTPEAHGVSVSLMMFTVEPIHMSTTFYVVYGVGDDAEQMPIDIILKENNGGNMLTPVTVLSSLLMVLIGRLVARNL